MTAPAPIPTGTPLGSELPTPQQAAPNPFTWSVERYNDAIAKGLLTENDRVELLFGLLNEKMPVGKRHADCVDDLTAYFAGKYKNKYRLRPQNPITIGDNSQPEPDFAIINRATYATRGEILYRKTFFYSLRCLTPRLPTTVQPKPSSTL